MKVLLVSNMYANYRCPIWNKLSNSESYDFTFMFDNRSIQGIKNANKSGLKVKNLKNIFFRNILIWQRGVLQEILSNKYDVVIFLGEMNILSTWIGALLLKRKKTKSCFWGHGLYGNESLIKLKLRKIFLSLADLNLVYGNHSKKLMINNGFNNRKIAVVFNSLLTKSITNYNILKDHQNDKKYIIFIGRLYKTKKIELLLEAFSELILNQDELSLLIIGEGPEKNLIESKYNNLIVQKKIKLLGAIYDEKILAKYISNALLYVSPGNVGLGAIHSLSYGTPVCTHSNINNQMPEFEALDSNNSVLFTENSKSSLLKAIERGIKLKNNSNNFKNCFKPIKELYNSENQFNIITHQLTLLLK